MKKVLQLDDQKIQLRIMEKRCQEHQLEYLGTTEWPEIMPAITECIRKKIEFLFFCDLNMPSLPGEMVLASTGGRYLAGNFVIYTASLDRSHVMKLRNDLIQAQGTSPPSQERGQIFAIQKGSQTLEVLDQILTAFREGTLAQIKDLVHFPEQQTSGRSGGT